MPRKRRSLRLDLQQREARDNPSSIAGNVFRDASGNGLTTDDTAHSGVVVYLDTNNNKVRDTGEQSKTTAADGSYQFTGLAAGTYRVREVVPSNFVRTNPTLADNYTVNLTATGSTGNHFANYEKPPSGALQNIRYTIVRANGTTTQVTNLRGNTKEGDLVTVNFTVKPTLGKNVVASFMTYTAPESYFNANTASQQKVYDLVTGSYAPGVTYNLTVRVPNCNYQIDLVTGLAIDKLGPANSNIFYSPQSRLLSADNQGSNVCIANPSTISGYKFNDLNVNGEWDADEKGLANWGIYIDTNGNGALDSGERSAVTDASGFYKINNLPGGTYKMREVMKTSWVQSLGGGDVSISSGATITGVNFGNYQTSVIGNRVWFDTDRNGVQDVGESGAAGVTVKLLGGSTSETVLATTTTNAQGIYAFTGLAKGTYKVQFTALDGYNFTTANVGNDNSDSDADATGLTGPIVLADNVTDLSNDAGLVLNAAPPLTGSIGNFVWLDDGDGIQESGESGLADIRVDLYLPDGTYVTSQTTDADGHYSFDGLAPGQYQIQVFASGYLFTKSNIGEDTNDSDVDSDGLTELVTVVGGQANNDVDAGLLRLASLSGRVVINGSDTGIATTLYLSGVDQDGNAISFGVDEGGNTITEIAVTSENGDFTFGNLVAGTYSIREDQPANFIDGDDFAGTTNGLSPNGVSDGFDAINGIVVAWGDIGVDYRFTETQDGGPTT